MAKVGLQFSKAEIFLKCDISFYIFAEKNVARHVGRIQLHPFFKIIYITYLQFLWRRNIFKMWHIVLHIACCGLFLLFKRSKFIQYEELNTNALISWSLLQGKPKVQAGPLILWFYHDYVKKNKKQRVELRMSFGDQFYLFCFNIGFFVMKLRDKKLKIIIHLQIVIYVTFWKSSGVITHPSFWIVLA